MIDTPGEGQIESKDDDNLYVNLQKIPNINLSLFVIRNGDVISNSSKENFLKFKELVQK